MLLVHLGTTAYFGFHPSSVFVQYQSSGFGSHIWGHMGWPHAMPHVQLDKLLFWYTLRGLIFVVSKFPCANVPFRVNSCFLTPLTFPSVVVKTYQSTENQVPDLGLGTLGTCPGASTTKGLHKSRH